MNLLIESEKGFKYEVIRTTRRKTASIQVHNGQVKIIVPENLSEQRIQQIVAKKYRWIKDKLKLHQDTDPVRTKEYISGEGFCYLGKNYRLKVISGELAPVKLKSGQLIVQTPKISVHHNHAIIQEQLTAWYQKHAIIKLKEKTNRYVNILEVNPLNVTIKSYKSRWGSCSSRGEIIYNWRIIMAPHCIVDYVVVHELCHLIHQNHSKMFWKYVESIMPQYHATISGT